MPGTGAFTLTGQIGDVMRESATAALSLVRSRAGKWKWSVSYDHLKKTDIHIHVPAGGIPKDGPSAGVAMLAALVSLLSDKPANAHVAMTGEITLRGQVLPVGGVKEKVLAAHRAGVKTVILPARNKPDLQDVTQDVRDALRFAFADRVEDVLAVALSADRSVAEQTAAGSRDRRSDKSAGNRPAGLPRKRIAVRAGGRATQKRVPAPARAPSKAARPAARSAVRRHQTHAATPGP
jgi:ATP-dependent Lon protease